MPATVRFPGLARPLDYYLAINAGERPTKEEVDLYTACRLEIRWHEQAIVDAVPQDVLRLNTERQELQEKFAAAFK